MLVAYYNRDSGRRVFVGLRRDRTESDYCCYSSAFKGLLLGATNDALPRSYSYWLTGDRKGVFPLP